METLDALFREYCDVVNNYSYRFRQRDEYWREELVAETWAKATRFFHQYKQGTNFVGWITTIMWNQAINMAREYKKKKVLYDEAKDVYGITAWKVYDKGEPVFSDWRDDCCDEVVDAIASLPDRWAMLIILKDVEGWRQKDIATEMGIPLGSVQSGLNRARQIVAQKVRRAA